MQFGFNLEDNLFALHAEIRDKKWSADVYTSFFVTDPKRRHIHKATVRDRILYQAVYRRLYPIFDKRFIHDSYSSRKGKGTHSGVVHLDECMRKMSANYTKRIYALKCDVKRFFDSIDHSVLYILIARRISDPDLLSLIEAIIKSFETVSGKGLPLGNVTSQLFANVYLNEFDQFVKRVLKVKFYLRYCDDFVILGETKEELIRLLVFVHRFLAKELQVALHPRKISIRTPYQGVDFLGYVSLSGFRVLRTCTKKRIVSSYIRDVAEVKTERDRERLKSIFYSYKGLLSHCRGYHIWCKLCGVFKF